MPAPLPLLKVDFLQGNVNTELYLRVGGDATMTSQYKVPLVNAASFSFNGTTQSVDLYGENASRVLKTGAPASFGFTLYQGLKSVLNQSILNAVKKTGNDARGTFILVLGDRSAFDGNFIMNGMNLSLAVRDPFSAPVTALVDGEPRFTPDVDAP